MPNWLIDQLNLEAGECAAPATFSVVARAALPGETSQATVYHWQRNGGSGFTNISGATADLACQFRAVVGTLGMSVTSAVVRITIPAIQVQAHREGVNVVVMEWPGHASEPP